MTSPDFNLLITLEALLDEGSVAGAARRLRLSPSAMSRALERLRQTTGDPLLVRAGRGLVPTPRALALHRQVGQLVQDVQAALRPVEQPDLQSVVRTFTLRTREGFVENFGLDLISRVRQAAPGLRLRFTLKTTKDSAALREGRVDLETGVIGTTTGPEVRAQALFQDRFIGVVREGHELSRGELTPARFAAGQHIAVSRRGEERGQVDDALALLGHERVVATIVDGYAAALALVKASDLIAVVPERYTRRLRHGAHSFPLPVPVPGFTISLLWHPRVDADPVHRWLRGCVRQVCADNPASV